MANDTLEIHIGYDQNGQLTAIGNTTHIDTSYSDNLKIQIKTGGWKFDTTRLLDISPSSQYFNYKAYHGVWVYDPLNNFSVGGTPTDVTVILNNTSKDIQTYPTHQFCVLMITTDGQTQLMYDPYVRDRSIGAV